MSDLNAARTRSRWTPEDEERLKSLYPDPKLDVRNIAELFGRSVDAIHQRAHVLGLIRRDRPNCRINADADSHLESAVEWTVDLHDRIRSRITRGDDGTICLTIDDSLVAGLDEADELLIACM